MNLAGVSETTLWTLHNRASEAKRPDRLITDPMAVRLFDTIDYDYSKFGPPTQYHPLRAVAFDRQIRAYLSDHPKAAVVALAEGLQTTFWRLDNGGIRWYSIDLPPVMLVRRRLLPTDDRIVSLAHSAFDLDWIAEIDSTDGVFITVEGLFMYFDVEQIRTLIGACAQRFPGGRMMFDNHPPWMSRRARHGFRLSPTYTTPPMPFALSYQDCQDLTSIPGVASAIDVDLPGGRGIWRLLDQKNTSQTRPILTLLTFA